jgi:hypothetical protein
MTMVSFPRLDSTSSHSKNLSPGDCRQAGGHRQLLTTYETLPLTSRTADRQPFDEDSISRVMSDHGHDDRPSSDTICMHSDYWQTTACTQFFPAQRKMRVAYDTACRAQYEEFQL